MQTQTNEAKHKLKALPWVSWSEHEFCYRCVELRVIKSGPTIVTTEFRTWIRILSGIFSLLAIPDPTSENPSNKHKQASDIGVASSLPSFLL